MEPISIVGGGPSGCSTGIFLAKKGFSNITIYERNPNIRKACGGGLSWRIVDRYGEFVKDVESYPVKSTHFDFDGRTLDFEFKKNIGVIVDRLEFDRNLREVAGSYGVEIIRKIANMENLKSKTIVDASGTKRSEHPCICAQAFTKFRNPKMSLFFRTDVNPSSYFWIFPMSDNYANIGLGGNPATFKVPLLQAFRNFTKEFGMKVGRTYLHPISMFSEKTSLTQTARGRTILRVGEAASLVNSATGEGIYYALRSGELAAYSISNGNQAKMYENSIKKEIFGELKHSESVYNSIMCSPRFLRKYIFLFLLKMLNYKRGDVV
jgi:flavin-dependent dehydrogenase